MYVKYFVTDISNLNLLLFRSDKNQRVAEGSGKRNPKFDPGPRHWVGQPFVSRLSVNLWIGLRAQSVDDPDYRRQGGVNQDDHIVIS
jgi:hypothetical protein